MVNALAYKEIEYNDSFVDIPDDEVKWCTVSLNDVKKAKMRLEASVFDIEGRYAREQIHACKWGIIELNKLLKNAYYPGRFKRIYSDSSSGVPFFLPSQLTNIYPKPDKYISALTKCNISDLCLKKDDVLITRSGTIGSVTLVSKTLENSVFSDDVIRVTTKNQVDSSFLYIYLKSKIGSTILQTNGYGSVITHIEPEHLASIPIPNPPDDIKKRIHNLVTKSFELRDESNDLIDEATSLLIKELQLPPIDQIKVKQFCKKVETNNYSVQLSNISGRLDASYHNPIVEAIIKHLKKNAGELTTIGNKKICKDIILPGRFKRIYVEEGQGQIFFSGKNIFELDPSDKKYLSFSLHEKRIKEQLTIRHNMILITCSGTVGNVVLVPLHWDKWAMTHDIIRLLPNSEKAGYIFIWLQSIYAKTLMQSMAYGAVVPHIEISHISKIPVPLLKNKSIQTKINNLALEANKKRYEAYILEQKAMRVLNDEVIYASKVYPFINK